MIINALLILAGLGLLASIMLAIASKIFYVWEDPKIELVEEALLGANCGGCGYAGCAAAAEAVVKGNAKLDVCSAGGFEVAQGVAAVMGETIEEKEPEISRPGCYYGLEDAALKFSYEGVSDCRAAALLFGGSKECEIGCLGLGTCVRACPFDALKMGANYLPVVNKDRCVSCGICADVCPKNIITLSSATRRILSDQKISECTAPCQRYCPAEIDVPEYIRQIAKGDYLKAVEVIREKNPFPLICGWICPAPCELECRRNLIDEPVSIDALKKFVSLYEMKNNIRKVPYLPPDGGKRIAVIGGGVEGLTAAYYLRRLGYRPKIFEASSQLGGILRYVITEDRLPRDVLDWEIKGILDIGIEAELETILGKDITFSSLFEMGFDSILLTSGGWDSRQIMMGKESRCMLPSTYFLLDFTMAHLRDTSLVLGKSIMILGGGDLSSKVAQKCLENGAKEVTVALPCSEAEAEKFGWEKLKSANLKVLYSVEPAELTGKGDQLESVMFVSSDGSQQKVKIDTLIVGAGRFPEMLFEKNEGDFWKSVPILNALLEDSNGGIFVVGTRGRTTDLSGVVQAVRRGRKIVRGLHLYLNEEEISPEYGVIVDKELIQNIDEISHPERLISPRGVVDNKIDFDEKEARRQAERCLNCGLICYKKELDQETVEGKFH